VEPVLRVGPVTFVFLFTLKKSTSHTDTDVMADETPTPTEALNAAPPEVPEEVVAPAAALAEPPAQPVSEPPAAPEPVAAQATEPQTPREPDALQPFIDKAHATIENEVEADELNKFLRAHIKTFREAWETWSDSAKDTYVHMMTTQLLHRKAAAKQIAIGNLFKLPEPSAQANFMASLERSQVKSDKRYPAIDLPPKLRNLIF